jgi:hypothetical protein
MDQGYAEPADETLEEYLELLNRMRSVVRVEQVSEWGRLRALDEIITLAVGDSPRAAMDFADKVALGLVTPDGD